MNDSRRFLIARLLILTAVLLVAVATGVAYAGNNGGSALDFSDANQVAISEGASVSNLGLLPGGFTLEAWIYPRTVAGGVHRYSIIRNNNDYNLYINPFGNLVAEVFPGGTGTGDYLIQTADAPLSAGQWYHVAAVSDTLGLRLYVNGALFASSSLTSTYTGPEQLWIGNDNTFQFEWFDGYIDEVRIWNTARPVAQIQTTMFQELVGTEANLVGYWRFNDGAGTSAADSSGDGNTGTLGGTPLPPAWVASSTAPLGSLTATYQNGVAGMWLGTPDTAADGLTTGLDVANAGFLNAPGDDIIFGHNNASFQGGVTANLPGGVDKRWARLWQLDVNDAGTTGGNVTLTFDISEAGGTSGDFSGTGTYFLLKRATGSSDTFAIVPVVGSPSVSGDRLTFTVDTANLGSEFTVGALNSPTAIGLSSLEAHTTTSPLAWLFGGVGVALIGAATWFRRRSRG